MREDLSCMTKEQAYMETMFAWQLILNATQAAHLLQPKMDSTLVFPSRWCYQKLPKIVYTVSQIFSNITKFIFDEEEQNTSFVL